jgi:DNA topoisomerase-1
VALKELGAHPTDGQPVRVLAGRYGPYVKHGAVNANVPKGADPTALTMDEAVALLAAREGSSGGKKTRKAKPSPRTANVVKAKKPAAKKAAKKKAAS